MCVQRFKLVWEKNNCQINFISGVQQTFTFDFDFTREHVLSDAKIYICQKTSICLYN